MLNTITIMGRLTRDPDLRRTGSGIAVASFTLAVDRDFSGKDSSEKETDFIDCVAWRTTGEFVAKHFTKGRMAVVQGRLQIRSWNDKDGNKRRSAEVVADNVYFGDSKRDGSNQQADASQAGAYAAPAYAGTGFAPAAPAAPGAPTAPNASYGFGGYANPGAPASDFAMMDDSDAQLPF